MTNAWSLLYDEVLKMKTDHYLDKIPEIHIDFAEAFKDVDIDVNLDTITGATMADLKNDNGFGNMKKIKL